MRQLLDRFGVTVVHGHRQLPRPAHGQGRPPVPPGGRAPACAARRSSSPSARAPVRPPQFPFEHDRVHDSDELLYITPMPRSLAVIGAGVIGSEYACMFAALGTRVHLIDGRDTLLPFLDPDLSKALDRGDGAARRRVPLEGERSTTCRRPDGRARSS